MVEFDKFAVFLPAENVRVVGLQDFRAVSVDDDFRLSVERLMGRIGSKVVNSEIRHDEISYKREPRLCKTLALR